MLHGCGVSQSIDRPLRPSVYRSPPPARISIYLSSFVAVRRRSGGGRCGTWPPPVQEANRPCLLPAARGPVRQFTAVASERASSVGFRVELPSCTGGKSEHRQETRYLSPLHQTRRRTKFLIFQSRSAVTRNKYYSWVLYGGRQGDSRPVEAHRCGWPYCIYVRIWLLVCTGVSIGARRLLWRRLAIDYQRSAIGDRRSAISMVVAEKGRVGAGEARGREAPAAATIAGGPPTPRWRATPARNRSKGRTRARHAHLGVEVRTIKIYFSYHYRLLLRFGSCVLCYIQTGLNYLLNKILTMV